MSNPFATGLCPACASDGDQYHAYVNQHPPGTTFRCSKCVRLYNGLASAAFKVASVQMSAFWRLRYALLALRRWPAHFLFSPAYIMRLTLRRLLFTATRRFVGPSLVCPLTGETIFNIQSLINAFGMHALGESDGPWQQLLRETPAPMVFDVGSNIGQFRAFALSFNPAAQVRTFDAWPDLSRYVPADSHCQTAIGAITGEILTLKRSAIGWTASTQPNQPGCDAEESKVYTTTLDHEWDLLGNPPVTLIKIDIDGAEREALKGAQRILQRTRCVLIETSHIEEVKSLCRGREWSTSNGFDFCGVQS